MVCSGKIAKVHAGKRPVEILVSTWLMMMALEGEMGELAWWIVDARRFMTTTSRDRGFETSLEPRGRGRNAK